MYFYTDKSGVVSLCSEQKMNSILREYELKPTTDELEKIRNGYIAMVIYGKLVFEETEKMKVDKIKELISQSSTIQDIKIILNKLLE